MKLIDFAEITAGYPFREVITEDKSSDIVAIQMKNITKDNDVIWNECTRTKIQKSDYSKFLQKSDILFSARGNNNNAVLINEIPENVKVIAAPQFFIIRIKNQNNKSQFFPPEILMPEFLTWQLNQRECQNYFKKEAEGSVTKSIRRSVFENTPITLLTVEKQKQIVAMANTLEKENQLLNQQIANNKRLMEGVALNILKQNKGAWQ